MLLWVLVTFTVQQIRYSQSESILEAVYWEIKPFLFTNKNGDLDGIIPRMFSEGSRECGCKVNKTLIKFSRKESSRQSFYQLLHSDTQYGEGNLQNISREKAAWFPSLGFYDRRNETFNKFRNIKSFKMMKSMEMAVIVPRYVISLSHKLLRGILSCGQIMIISLLFSILFGIIIWMVECCSNEKFARNFLQGTGNGMWWSLVSMTTVGYGDVIPRSFFGRLVALVWVILGVIIACVMTATTTQIVTGVDHLSVYQKKVSVLENSIEEKEASENYGAHVIPAISYSQALDYVRHGRVFAAIINADVAAWYQDEIRSGSVPLSIVKTLHAHVDINAMMPKEISPHYVDIFRCMHNNSEKVYVDPVDRYRRFCHLEMLHVDSFKNMIKEDLIIQTLLGVVIILLVTGICFDLHSAKKNRRQSQAHRQLLPDIDAPNIRQVKCGCSKRKVAL